MIQKFKSVFFAGLKGDINENNTFYLYNTNDGMKVQRMK